MAQASWGQPNEKRYQSGVDRGMLYVDGHAGVPWNGLISVEESSDVVEYTPHYVDGLKYANSGGFEDFAATITAFYSPDVFDECDGSYYILDGFAATGQRRKSFGFSYRTGIGNDLEGLDHGYKLHLVFNALATPSSVTHDTLNDDSEAANLSWEITTRPLVIEGYPITAHFVIDSTRVDKLLLWGLESILYGSSEADPRMPTPAEIVEISQFKLIDHNDGTFTMRGLDEVIRQIGDIYILNQVDVTFESEDVFIASYEEEE